MANTALSTGDAKGDVYIGIDLITGSAFADVMIGGAFTDTLVGEDGNDKLNGRRRK